MDSQIDSPSPTPKSGWGGARPGSGRKRRPPPDPAIVGAIRRAVADQVMPNLPRLVEALVDLAVGSRVAVRGPDGNPTVYSIAPDAHAAACLLELIVRAT